MATPAASPRTILVLGGGGALGAYQAGALLALAEAGILPDAIYACSVGALNGAFLASNPSVAQAARLAEWWVDTRTRGVLEPSMWGRLRGLAAAAANGARALFDERPLRRLIAANVRAHDISELAIPLTVSTTCLDCGAAVHHPRGAVGDVLVASCALPGLFPPVRLSDGHRHVDGGVVCG
ncbi:MAG TPA: patatin-like phospholipase family protein, partial [Jatrophihabitans sp.]|nr:patatin-like phospholipase family protein [Jatrophihabitans sp.]